MSSCWTDYSIWYIYLLHLSNGGFTETTVDLPSACTYRITFFSVHLGLYGEVHLRPLHKLLHIAPILFWGEYCWLAYSSSQLHLLLWALRQCAGQQQQPTCGGVAVHVACLLDSRAVPTTSLRILHAGDPWTARLWSWFLLFFHFFFSPLVTPQHSDLS